MIYQKWNLKINGRTGKQQVLQEHLQVYARQLQGIADQVRDKSQKVHLALFPGFHSAFVQKK